MSDRPINTLIIEDDPILAEAHRTFTERVPGFAVAGMAHFGRDALRLVATRPVDVLLLDVNLPDMSGIELCRTLRAHRNAVDVIAVTSARDLATVRSAVSLGVVQYLLKPFAFASFQDKLHAYAEYRRRTAQAPGNSRRPTSTARWPPCTRRRSGRSPKDSPRRPSARSSNCCRPTGNSRPRTWPRASASPSRRRGATSNTLSRNASPPAPPPTAAPVDRNSSTAGPPACPPPPTSDKAHASPSVAVTQAR